MSFNQAHSNYQRVYSQPAYILHTSPYQNTSLLVDAFTAEYGRIRFVAKGAKRLKSPFAGKLEVFTPILLSWSGRSDLYTLTEAELANGEQRTFLNGQLQLRGSSLLSAYYVNELILRFMTLEDPHTELFNYYISTLEKLILKQSVESTLRIFEKHLLQESGYSLLLTHEAITGAKVSQNTMYFYALTEEEGPVKYNGELPNSGQESLYISGKTLLELEQGAFSSKETLKQAKILMRSIISKHLGDTPLKTRSLFQSTIL